MDDFDPVCSVCKMPAVRRGDEWVHASAVDAVFCSILRGMSPTITED